MGHGLILITYKSVLTLSDLKELTRRKPAYDELPLFKHFFFLFSADKGEERVDL